MMWSWPVAGGRAGRRRHTNVCATGGCRPAASDARRGYMQPPRRRRQAIGIHIHLLRSHLIHSIYQIAEKPPARRAGVHSLTGARPGREAEAKGGESHLRRTRTRRRPASIYRPPRSDLPTASNGV
ncbi:hypothetical protein DAI22_02g300600 [Oryza sativa Japonica Group]|jgi:hypothetical protein|nr:hypothetical protein DAI22_02g300600 [Oryza sativa Japonica Group]